MKGFSLPSSSVGLLFCGAKISFPLDCNVCHYCCVLCHSGFACFVSHPFCFQVPVKCSQTRVNLCSMPPWITTGSESLCHISISPCNMHVSMVYTFLFTFSGGEDFLGHYRGSHLWKAEMMCHTSSGFACYGVDTKRHEFPAVSLRPLNWPLNMTLVISEPSEWLIWVWHVFPKYENVLFTIVITPQRCWIDYSLR